MTDNPNVWNGDYKPTPAELDEPVMLEDAEDMSLEEAAQRIFAFKPPSDATWPED